MVPRIRDRTIKAFFDLETGRLDIVEEMLEVGESDAHGTECVQVQQVIYKTKSIQLFPIHIAYS